LNCKDEVVEGTDKIPLDLLDPLLFPQLSRTEEASLKVFHLVD
tara:strand:+ start:3486 stop:3614 length:129 start_codon:yes stop_codon:yes gene_type:complete